MSDKHTSTLDRIRSLSDCELNTAVEMLLYGDDLTANTEERIVESVWSCPSFRIVYGRTIDILRPDGAGYCVLATLEWGIRETTAHLRSGADIAALEVYKQRAGRVYQQALESYVANWRVAAPNRHWSEVWQRSCEQGRPFNLLASNTFVSMADYYRVSFAALDIAVRRQACLLAIETNS